MESIKDKVAIIGMGCVKFGENWEKSPEDMMVEAAFEAYQDAGIDAKDIQAGWFGRRRLAPEGPPSGRAPGPRGQPLDVGRPLRRRRGQAHPGQVFGQEPSQRPVQSQGPR